VAVDGELDDLVVVGLADEEERRDGGRRRQPRARQKGVVQAVDELLRRAGTEPGGGRDERAEAGDADRDAGRRNVSLTPAARPLCSLGTEPSATAITDGLNRPTPKSATSSPGRITVHDEPTPASVNRTIPMATRPSPTEIMIRAETFSPTWLLAPATTKFRIVPGR
jgi:hypothetical protein